MAVYPNTNSIGFCNFLIDATYLDITAPRLVIINEVLTAANASTSVTNAVWNNFMLATGEYYQYYIAYQEQISSDTADWIDISATSTIVGWSAYTTKKIAYKINNKVMTVYFFIDGTSNATTITFTVPVACAGIIVSITGNIYTINNGIAATTSGFCNIQPASTTVNVYRTMNQTAWTNVNQKVAAGTIIIPVA